MCTVRMISIYGRYYDVKFKYGVQNRMVDRDATYGYNTHRTRQSKRSVFIDAISFIYTLLLYPFAGIFGVHRLKIGINWNFRSVFFEKSETNWIQTTQKLWIPDHALKTQS